MSDHWQVHAVKYAERNSRTRADSFLMDDHPAAPHGMDYYEALWEAREEEKHGAAPFTDKIPSIATTTGLP